MSSFTIEVVTSSVRSSVNAQNGGAGRIELCSALATAGVTPSSGLLEAVKQHVRIPVYVMIRPREGDFCYDKYELEVMKREIDLLKKSGADGFVFGVLHDNGMVNFEITKQLVDYCKPLPVTFHRAFDCTPDLAEALETIIETGCERILTSGGKANGLEGIGNIIDLNQKAAGRISLMPGGGIRPETFDDILHTEIREYHMSGRSMIKSPMYPTLFEMDWAETETAAIKTVVAKCAEIF